MSRFVSFYTHNRGIFNFMMIILLIKTAFYVNFSTNLHIRNVRWFGIQF
jgi:hypothetical protein